MGQLAKKASTRPRTIFDDVEPLSEEEKKRFEEKWRREWFERNVGTVVALAIHDKTLADKLAEECAVDTDLRQFLKEQLKLNRGRPKEWGIGRYISILVHYYVFYEASEDAGRNDRSEYAFERLADFESICTGRSMSVAKIKQHFTKARRIVSADDLPPFARSVLKKKKKPHKE